MARKLKIAFSISEDVVIALKAQAPGGNSSAFVESSLRKNLCMEPLPNDKLGQLIQKLKNEKEGKMDVEFKKGFEMGKDDALDGIFSLSALEVLSENLQPNMVTWLDTEEMELNDRYQNAAERADLHSKMFCDGYWKGVLSVWNEIKNKI